MERDKPLCMYGFGLLFGATRVPQVGRDQLETNFKRRHIVVLCNHQVFRVEAMTPDGRAISPDKLEAILEQIKAKAESQPGDPDSDVGVLTAQERDSWAKLRAAIAESGEPNRATLEAIDDCLFAIALDSTNCTNAHEVSQRMLSGGDGTTRWFDKHNIIATADGALGMNFDHTFGDGLTWNRMLSEVWADINGTRSPFAALPAADDAFAGSWSQLNWELPAAVKSEMRSARRKAADLAGDVDFYSLEFGDFGRNRMKEMKMSPDAVCQMAFQLAFARLHGKPAAVYESCAMKNFFHGRTETIRSCTTDMAAMMKTFLNDGTDDAKRAALQAAAKTHVEVAKGAKAAVAGPYQGVDRHLHAMKCLAAERGVKVPFYEDPMYAASATWRLSTSNVTAPFIRLFGFGPVTGNGYGLGYMTQPESVPVNVSSFKSGQTDATRSEKMGEAITQTLRDFDRLFK